MLLCLALIGGASTAAPEKLHEPTASNKYEVNWEYVTKVERNSRGALPGRIVWVNPLLKKVGEEQ